MCIEIILGALTDLDPPPLITTPSPNPLVHIDPPPGPNPLAELACNGNGNGK